jgi:hypothetical protein
MTDEAKAPMVVHLKQGKSPVYAKGKSPRHDHEESSALMVLSGLDESVVVVPWDNIASMEMTQEVADQWPGLNEAVQQTE